MIVYILFTVLYIIDLYINNIFLFIFDDTYANCQNKAKKYGNQQIIFKYLLYSKNEVEIKLCKRFYKPFKKLIF